MALAESTAVGTDRAHSNLQHTGHLLSQVSCEGAVCHLILLLEMDELHGAAFSLTSQELFIENYRQTKAREQRSRKLSYESISEYICLFSIVYFCESCY